MTAHLVKRFVLLCAVLAPAAPVHAQEAVLTGTVTDSTGAVLPGVTITALHETTGNRFTAVTDERGAYRIQGRIGAYQITGELQGFTTVTRAGVQLLVGQTGVINLQMAPSTVQETVTVTAEAPLLEVTTSSLGGNIDPQQVQELPVQGRNWMALALLAPGSRTSSTNADTPLPDRNGGEVREFQLNLDGQQVTSYVGAGGEASYSQDSIAEFQFISNRFDATQGRSSGVQVNAVTKSGTNTLSGLFRGNFRDDRFNAKAPHLNRVVPISNQQLSTAVGGPLVRDKLHYFANFEYEREPRTLIWNTPFPAFNIELSGKNTRKMGGLRGDYQLSTETRLMAKWHQGREFSFGNAGTGHPAGRNTESTFNNEYLGQLTQVLSNRAVNELKVGLAEFGFETLNVTTWSRHWQAANGITAGHPRITFTGFSIAGNGNAPRQRDQQVYSVRDDFTFSYEARGRHDLKAGGEFLYDDQYTANCRQCNGNIDARGGPIPANIEAIFPDWRNADTWNLAAISSITRTYQIGIGNFPISYDHRRLGGWVQDDWQMSSNLTLNLGLRYDLTLNAFANEASLPPFVQASNRDDRNNIQPRLGFAYQLDDRTVLRGGSGLYFADALTVDTMWMIGNTQINVIQYVNDGRPDFALNPTGGRPLPSYEESLTQFCYANGNAPGCLFRSLQEIVAPDEFMMQARSWQTSFGFQRQIGETMAVEVDYVYTKGTGEKDPVDNMNVGYNPATGVNYPFTDRARRPYPDWGTISMIPHTARSEYHGLQTGFTKRFSNRWQASATYTLAGFWDAATQPFSGLEMVPFEVQPDLGNEWGLSETDQRHRAVFNGIWQVGRGFQVSGLHYFGAGIRSSTTYGGDQRNLGATGSARLRPNGTIVPRNSFVQPAQNRTDIRFQQRVPLGGRVAIDGIAEIFNIFNRPNWNISTQESSPDFGRRISGQNRTAQFGFRLTF